MYRHATHKPHCTCVCLQGGTDNITLNINTNSMWRTRRAGNPHDPTSVPTAHRVALGGLIFKVPGANFTEFAAEQHIADGVLVTRQTTAGGASFTTTTQLHPQLQVLETVFSWSPGNGTLSGSGDVHGDGTRTRSRTALDAAGSVAMTLTTWVAGGSYTTDSSAGWPKPGPRVGLVGSGSTASCCSTDGQ